MKNKASGYQSVDAEYVNEEINSLILQLVFILFLFSLSDYCALRFLRQRKNQMVKSFDFCSAWKTLICLSIRTASNSQLWLISSILKLMVHKLQLSIYWISRNYLSGFSSNNTDSTFSDSTSEMGIDITYVWNLFLHQGAHLIQSFSIPIVFTNFYWQLKQSVSWETTFRLACYSFTKHFMFLLNSIASCGLYKGLPNNLWEP